MPRKRRKNKVYSAALKLQAVQDYLAGKGSQRKICRGYDISAHKMLREVIVPLIQQGLTESEMDEHIKHILLGNEKEIE